MLHDAAPFGIPGESHVELNPAWQTNLGVTVLATSMGLTHLDCLLGGGGENQWDERMKEESKS